MSTIVTPFPVAAHPYWEPSCTCPRDLHCRPDCPVLAFTDDQAVRRRRRLDMSNSPLLACICAYSLDPPFQPLLSPLPFLLAGLTVPCWRSRMIRRCDGGSTCAGESCLSGCPSALTLRCVLFQTMQKNSGCWCRAWGSVPGVGINQCCQLFLCVACMVVWQSKDQALRAGTSRSAGRDHSRVWLQCCWQCRIMCVFPIGHSFQIVMMTNYPASARSDSQSQCGYIV